MYKNSNLKKSFEDSTNSEDDFDFCNTETGQKFAIKWSPSDDIKFVSKHRFSGTRSLGRSITRRKRSLFQYKINRSLNFEIGTPRHEAVFKSPNFDSDDSPVCNEKYLTRSAKILRSLNINFSPSNTRNRKINKTLNFDLSPSPKRIFSSSESLFNKESPKYETNINRMSKINKTLNFSSSSNGSHLSSCLDSSVESIDENQNQTPSHRSRSVKKSLNYLTPSPKPNANLLRSVNKTPMSREEFIKNLKYNAETPESHFNKQNENKSKHFDGINVSTPRNLFHAFEDEDKDMRPTTPENIMQFVPESMSAIKKSHKKERQSNRLEKINVHELRGNCNRTENSSEDPIMLSHSGERPATPITNDTYPSPNYSLGSIKQSHKKDKSKKKSVITHSEDEISDSGSIFDYTELLEKKPDAGNQILDNSSLLSSGSSDFGMISSKGDNVRRPICLDNSIEELSDHGSIFDYSERLENKSEPNSGQLASKMNVHDQLDKDYSSKDKEPLKLSFDKLELISPVKAEGTDESGSPEISKNEDRPTTPENVINVLDQVMSDSIKKSHKKIKDKNKKILFKLQPSIEEPTKELSPLSNNSQEKSLACDNCTPETVARAGTPENVNSSRLLLGQYSSVKKSHKKNKHKKIVTESAKRQRYFHNDDRYQASRDSSLVSGVRTLLSPSKNLATTNAPKRRKSISPNKSSIVAPATGIEISSTTPDKESANNLSVESSTADRSPLERSTPNKRKKSFSLNETGTSISSVDSSYVESSMDYESAEEEFKIFTPIKKRRDLRSAAGINGTEKSTLKSQELQCSKLEDKTCATQDESFKSIENSFATPPNRNKNLTAARENNSMSKAYGEVCDNGNANGGRSTPQNRSTSEMIFDINSIKKSHKKDKRNSRLRRSSNVADERNDFKVIKDEEVDEDRKPISCHQTVALNNSTSEDDVKNPKPSTSFSGSVTDVKMNETQNKEPTKTPPNCSKVINYLKLRQADSIKRSHKKIRERKRQSLIINDPDLSDDGSIFDSSDRIGSDELFNDLAVNIEPVVDAQPDNRSAAANGNVQAAAQPLPQTPPNTSRLIQIESIKKSHKKVREFRRKVGHLDVGGGQSENGSIFDPNERLDDSINDIGELEDSSKESSP